MNEVVLGVSLAAIGYVYVGYPLLLFCLVRIRGARPVRIGTATPVVSLVVSAFNEADVIRGKILNALALDYPAGKLEIVVVSDASSDGTDAIVEEYASRGVRLVRAPLRQGKTAGLNRTVPTLRGEVVVFSDANAMYEPDAVRTLVRNFGDPDVGCVTGEAQYVAGGQAVADVAERAYWGYEGRIKRLESAVGSMVGGDGAIYAIRRSLWQTLPADAINDFLNPLQIVAAGWRAVYEPRAICHEETAGNTGAEYRRRVPIVSRSWRAVFQAPGVLNPARVGLFAWSVVSHKVLRWLSGLFVLAGAMAAAPLAARVALDYPHAAAGAALFAAAAAAVPATRRASMTLAYYVVLSVASLVGVRKGISGRVSGIWATPRGDAAGAMPVTRIVPVGRLFLGAAAAVTAASVIVLSRVSLDAAATFTFWGAAGVLAYVYALFPAALSSLRPGSAAVAPPSASDPTVCVFIVANDEAEVIEAKLLNTLSLDYPRGRLDIIVASDGSVDGTNAIVERFAPFGVSLLAFARRRGKMATINEGMSSVRADIVVLSDANTILEAGAVRALVRGFADETVGAISGDVALTGERARLALSEDLYYRYERWVQRAESSIDSIVGVDGALYAIRRSLFVAPPDDTILDDMAVPMAVIRAGRRVRFEPAARAHEQGSETATEEFARKSRVIAGAVQFLGRRDSDVPLRSTQVMLSVISHKALRWLSPVFGLVLFASSVALAGRHPVYTVALAMQVAGAMLGLAGCVPALRRVMVIGVLHYFCLVQAAAAVGVVRGLRGRQSVLWRRFGRAHLNAPACAK